MKIKAIIFDCDGTLIDSEASHFYAWQKVVLQRNHFFALEDYIQCMGNSNLMIAERLAGKMKGPSVEELLAERLGYYQEHTHGQQAIQHTVEFALKLAQEKERLGLRIAVASAGKKEEILHSLKRIGIDEIFDFIISGTDDLPLGLNKPNPHIYWHTAKLLGVEPADCVVIEDSLPGLTAAVKAGCFTVAIPTASTQFQDLSTANIQLKSLENFSIEQFFQLVQEKPTIIFLNGTSSAGKTSLIPYLQERLDKPFIHVGIDHFLYMLPERYRMDGKEAHLGYHFERNDDKISITKGNYAHKLHRVMQRSMQNLLAQGFNLIIDEVLFAEDDFHTYLGWLQPYRVYFVAVKPPLEVAEQREKARGGRMLGLARGLYEAVYQNKIFDLEIDSSQIRPEEAADAVIQYMQAHPNPQAFMQNFLSQRG